MASFLFAHAGLSSRLQLHRSGTLVSPECAGLPVFLGHGTQDQMIQFKFAEASHKLLAEQGAQVRAHRHRWWPHETEADNQRWCSCTARHNDAAAAVLVQPS